MLRRRRTFASHRHTHRAVAAVVFEDQLPDLKKHSDGFAWACCPFHDDRNPSFCVNLESGWYRCFSSSCGLTGVGAVSFVSDLLEVNSSEAHRYLERHYG
jgi:DNA primase